MAEPTEDDKDFDTMVAAAVAAELSRKENEANRGKAPKDFGGFRDAIREEVKSAIRELADDRKASDDAADQEPSRGDNANNDGTSAFARFWGGK